MKRNKLLSDIVEKNLFYGQIKGRSRIRSDLCCLSSLIEQSGYRTSHLALALRLFYLLSPSLSSLNSSPPPPSTPPLLIVTDYCRGFFRHGWNLNILPHLPGSVLKHVGFVSGKKATKPVTLCEIKELVRGQHEIHATCPTFAVEERSELVFESNISNSVWSKVKPPHVCSSLWDFKVFEKPLVQVFDMTSQKSRK